jgi:hypothetical protein
VISLVSQKIDSVQSKLRHVADSIGRAISGGVNEAADRGVHLTEQSIRDMIALDRLEIYNAFNVEPANYVKTECTIQIDARFAVELSAFEAKQTPSGVEVQIYRYAPPVLYPDTFGPDTRLQRGIYRRISRKRFPIRRIKDIKLFEEPQVLEKVNETRGKLPAMATLAIQERVSTLVNSEVSA